MDNPDSLVAQVTVRRQTKTKSRVEPRCNLYKGEYNFFYDYCYFSIHGVPHADNKELKWFDIWLWIVPTTWKVLFLILFIVHIYFWLTSTLVWRGYFPRVGLDLTTCTVKCTNYHAITTPIFHHLWISERVTMHSSNYNC
jgi:hypothetical protein